MRAQLMGHDDNGDGRFIWSCSPVSLSNYLASFLCQPQRLSDRSRSGPFPSLPHPLQDHLRRRIWCGLFPFPSWLSLWSFPSRYRSKPRLGPPCFVRRPPGLNILVVECYVGKGQVFSYGLPPTFPLVASPTPIFLSIAFLFDRFPPFPSLPRGEMMSDRFCAPLRPFFPTPKFFPFISPSFPSTPNSPRSISLPVLSSSLTLRPSPADVLFVWRFLTRPYPAVRSESGKILCSFRASSGTFRSESGNFLVLSRLSEQLVVDPTPILTSFFPFPQPSPYATLLTNGWESPHRGATTLPSF